MLAGKPRRHSFFLICVSFAFLAAPVSWAATITVCGDGTGDYLTIQEGIDAAVAGDEVVICPGIYTGDGNRDLDYAGKAITVRSTDPEDPDVVAATVIDCQGTETEPHRGFNFHSSETADSILAGLTITNGYGPEEEIYGKLRSHGGAVLCISSSPTVENCVLSNNSSGYYGGGIFNYESNPTLTNCTFSGNSADRGGGMRNFESSPTLTNCMFSGNLADCCGGGISNVESNPMLVNCTFSGNSADWGGGGMSNWESSPMLANCTFSGNSADIQGGGMDNWESSSPTLTNCTFSGNSAYSQGGGMCNSYSSPALTKCTFSGNSAHHGGGMSNLESSSPTLTNCTFNGNSADRSGGGIYNDRSSPMLANCTFNGNSADFFNGGGMSNSGGSRPELTNCSFSGNSAVSGGGMFNWESSSPTLTNCTFSGNSAYFYGGGISNHLFSSPTLENCMFSGNSADYRGGGINNYHYSSPTLMNCKFSSNWANDGGGGMSNERSSPALANCTFSGNSADYRGGGMSNHRYSSPTLTNCTFSGNSADSNGGGIYNYNNSSPTLTNCILWGNSNVQIYDSAIVTYSCIQGGWPGIGNIDADPMFVEPGYWDDNGTPGDYDDDVWTNGDYHLLPGSPCMDAGDNTAVPFDTLDLDDDGDVTERIPFDLDGFPRFLDLYPPGGSGVADPPDYPAIVDMGAYEFQPITAELDILPDDDPNMFVPNKKSKGRIPMAILGSDELAADDINPDSIKIAGTVGPLKTSSDKDVDGDGLVDLVMHFSRRAMIDALSLDTYEVGATVDITVTANRLADGWPIAATDSIVIAGKGG